MIAAWIMRHAKRAWRERKIRQMMQRYQNVPYRQACVWYRDKKQMRLLNEMFSKEGQRGWNK